MVPSAKLFAQAFSKLNKSGQLSEIDRRMLICHYEAPEQKLTPRQMSKLMGWHGQSANRFYGDLARRVSKKLNWAATIKTAPRSYHVETLILGSRPNFEFV